MCLFTSTYCIWHLLLTVVYTHVGLACMPVNAFMRVYAQNTPEAKFSQPVLEINVMTMIGIWLLISRNSKPILAIRPYVTGDLNIRPDSSPKTIHSSLTNTHSLTD